MSDRALGGYFSDRAPGSLGFKKDNLGAIIVFSGTEKEKNLKSSVLELTYFSEKNQDSSE